MKDPIIGQTIKELRPMTPKEVELEGWPSGGTVLVLGNGTKLYASQDHEGNGPGAIFGTVKGGKCIGLP